MAFVILQRHASSDSVVWAYSVHHIIAHHPIVGRREVSVSLAGEASVTAKSLETCPFPATRSPGRPDGCASAPQHTSLGPSSSSRPLQ